MNHFSDGVPAVIAHRGASGLAPENTLAAIRLAWELAADAVEIDVRLTADGRVVVIHDATTKRTSGVNMVVKNASAAALRAIDIGAANNAGHAGERIPFLEEVLETIPEGRRLFIEIKCGGEILPRLEDIAGQSGKHGRIVFIGFGFAVMRRCLEMMPGIPAYWLCGIDLRRGVLAGEDFLAPVPEALRMVRDAGFTGIDLNHTGVRDGVSRMVRDTGLDLVVWTVNDPMRARRLAAAGVSGITTDQPGRIRGEFPVPENPGAQRQG